ncbi:hypothetical protein DV589_24790 [Salmonella enterica]|nr:hypothetical protein [Salmonella enterica]EKF0976926.1 hypothetical protein [Salmonella enterica]EKS5988130.1 hypothetical protein [Salmonella enterica]
MRRDVAKLIKNMMEEAGLSEAVDDDLDDRSVITFNMKNDMLPLHLINDENDNVWIWTELGEFTLDTLLYYSKNIIPIMIGYNEELFPLGQPCLHLVDDVLYLRAHFIDANLESTANFIDCVNYFMKLSQDYQSVFV